MRLAEGGARTDKAASNLSMRLKARASLAGWASEQLSMKLDLLFQIENIRLHAVDIGRPWIVVV